MDAITVINVTKILKGKHVLDNVSLHIPEHSITGIIGRNGSGKSMLFKAISGLMPINKGSIFVLGKPVGRNGAFPADIGILIEHPGFMPQYSAYRNLQMLAEIKGRINENDIISIMTEFGLDPKDRRPAKKYSLGMKQKIGIIQAIMERPRIVLLDEPTNNLDQESIIIMRTMLMRLREQGSTILLCSHNMEDISSICDKSYAMEEGQIVDSEAVHD